MVWTFNLRQNGRWTQHHGTHCAGTIGKLGGWLESLLLRFNTPTSDKANLGRDHHGTHCAGLTARGLKPRTEHIDSDVFNLEFQGRLSG
jgi:hypothetical protein